MRAINLLFFTLNLALFAFCTYFILSRGYVAGAGWSPVELVTTVLTALAVLIGALGIFIAALAIWGYTQLSEQARLVADKAARELVGEIAPKLVSEELRRQAGEPAAYGEAAGGDENAVEE